MLLRPKLIEIPDVSQIISNIDRLNQKQDTIDTQLNDLHNLIGVYETNLKHLEIKIIDVASRGESCITCKRVYTAEDKFESSNEKEKLESQKIEIDMKILDGKTKLSEYIETKDKCRNFITDLRCKIEEHNMQIKENENLLSRIEQLNNWNKQLIQDINKIKNEKDHVSILIEDAKKNEVVLQTNCSNLKIQIANMEVIKFIVSEEGVKSYIVKKILKLLNSKLLYYLKKFDANCTLRFNEYFEEQLIDDKGEETTYNSFSGGEKKRIDLACLFTFMDIRRLQGDVSTNISIYDELLDTSLEERGVNMVLDVLKERVEKYNEAIYIISHKREIEKYVSGSGEIIFLEKRGGLTTRLNVIPEIMI